MTPHEGQVIFTLFPGGFRISPHPVHKNGMAMLREHHQKKTQSVSSDPSENNICDYYGLGLFHVMLIYHLEPNRMVQTVFALMSGSGRINELTDFIDYLEPYSSCHSSYQAIWIDSRIFSFELAGSP
ncbi:MAG: hypothetical protein ACKO26_10275 [Planctomycetota bacterium]